MIEAVGVFLLVGISIQSDFCERVEKKEITFLFIFPGFMLSNLFISSILADMSFSSSWRKHFSSQEPSTLRPSPMSEQGLRFDPKSSSGVPTFLPKSKSSYFPFVLCLI